MNTLTLRSSLATAALGKPLVVVAAYCVAATTLPVHAHHSAAMYDSSREVVLEGTVQVMEWKNPHVWIVLSVFDEEGDTVQWGVEASNPLDLGQKGWTPDTFKAGDEVTITVHPAKHNKPYGSFIRATLPDGSLLDEGLVTREIDNWDAD